MFDLFNELIGYPSVPTSYYPYDYLGSLFVTFMLFSFVVYIIVSIFRR